MKVYFVTNGRAYSKFFLKLFKTTISHIGFGFSVNGYDFVIDANKPYGKHYLLKQWLLKYKIIKQVDIALLPHIEQGIYNTCIDKIVGISYNMGAYKYAAVCVILNRFFKIRLPTVNKWSEKDKLCCTEIFEIVKPVFFELGLNINDLCFDALLPDTILLELKNRAKGMNNVVFYETS